MKQTIFFILVLVLVSCTTTVAPAVAPTEKAPVTQTLALAEVSIVETTETPTQTLVPVTPTQDLLHVPTSTPQPPATCPAAGKNVRLPLGPVFNDKKAPYHDARSVILNFLNEGGNPQDAIEKLAGHNVFASTLDLTHDGVPEFILPSGYLTVFGCQDGQYVNLLDLPPSKYSQMTAVPLVIKDLNNNGRPEILTGQVDQQILAIYQILEWNGSEFENVAPKEFQKDTANLYIKDHVIYGRGQSNAEKGTLEGNWEIVDADGNGLSDIVFRAGVYQGAIVSSTLEESIILTWDGEAYTVAKALKESPPTATPTSTPLPFSATCSIKVPELHFQKPENTRLDKAILDYLNAGGMPEKIKGMKYGVTIEDLNNDTAPEVIMYEYGFPEFTMFTCQNGKYKKAETRSIQGDFVASYMEILAIKDNNKNGYPEVFVKGIGCFTDRCGGLYVIEWDGEQFAQKIKDVDSSGETTDYTRMSEPDQAYLTDFDGDGIAELVWTGERPLIGMATIGLSILRGWQRMYLSGMV